MGRECEVCGQEEGLTRCEGCGSIVCATCATRMLCGCEDPSLECGEVVLPLSRSPDDDVDPGDFTTPEADFEDRSDWFLDE